MKSILPLLIFTLLIALLSSSIAQFDWTKYGNNPVFGPGDHGEWDEYLSPSCMLFLEGTYHLWYGGFDNINIRIGYAYSSDGLIWEKYEGNPVLDIGSPGSWDDQRVIGPHVLFINDTLRMWYWAKDSSNNLTIGYATSTDKVTWTKYEHNPVLTPSDENWESEAVMYPCVYFDGTTYHMWYTGSSTNNVCIGYATSDNGTSWTRYEDNPVLKRGAWGEWDWRNVIAPRVLFHGNIFHMWYSGTNTYLVNREYQIGYATSPDGFTWTKYEHNPVLKPSDEGWDTLGVGFARALWDSVDNQYKMWYGGGNDTVDWKMGHATAWDPTGLFGIDDHLLPAAFLLHQNYPNPFNPTTVIGYRLPAVSNVELSVYNLLGQKVATLVSEKQNAGYHEMVWDASGFSSGIYYYQLVAGDYREVKKMILLR